MLIVAFSQNGIRWTLPRILTLVFMVVGDTPVFCLFLLYAAFSFVTLEDLEFMNVLTYGGRKLGQYPFAVYGKMVFTFYRSCSLRMVSADPTGLSHQRLGKPLAYVRALHRMIKDSSGAAVFS